MFDVGNQRWHEGIHHEDEWQIKQAANTWLLRKKIRNVIDRTLFAFPFHIDYAVRILVSIAFLEKSLLLTVILSFEIGNALIWLLLSLHSVFDIQIAWLWLLLSLYSMI